MLEQVAIEYRVPRLSEARISGSAARHLISRLAGNDLHPRIFHHGDDRVSTLKSPSLVRWSGGAKRFRLIGIGPLGIEDVSATVPILTNVLFKHYGGAAIDMIRTTCSLS